MALALCVCVGLRATDYTALVNPLVGTLSSFELSTGNTYPAIARPWGMNFWTPQTGRMGDGWQYVYTATKIRGFKQTHQPSPWINDYGQFSLMPVTGKLEFDEEKRASWFSHKGEVALPHYYKVYLADYDVVTEITPTERAAMFRFTFPESDASYVVIDAFDKGSHIRILPEQRRIEGYTTRNSWHYTWSAFHDPQGLINLMGGEETFVQMLDSVFTVPPLYDASYYGQVIHEIREMTVMNMGNYAHGNQPIQHMIYLYNYAGAPWKAQYWLRQVMNRMYSPQADGYSQRKLRIFMLFPLGIDIFV